MRDRYPIDDTVLSIHISSACAGTYFTTQQASMLNRQPTVTVTITITVACSSERIGPHAPQIERIYSISPDQARRQEALQTTVSSMTAMPPRPAGASGHGGRLWSIVACYLEARSSGAGPIRAARPGSSPGAGHRWAECRRRRCVCR